MNIEIPERVQRLLDRLESAGYEAYIVGGCVRDSIMGFIPHDFDVTTSALPEETEAQPNKKWAVTEFRRNFVGISSPPLLEMMGCLSSLQKQLHFAQPCDILIVNKVGR